MKIYNKSIEEYISTHIDSTIVVFGAGEMFRLLIAGVLNPIKERIAYVIDNSGISTATAWDCEYQVFRPEKVQSEKKCSIIISSSVYMSEMYNQLESLNLSDEIECSFYPFMMLAERNNYRIEDIYPVEQRNSSERIPRIIHSFWFSGDKKPPEYQSCVDTWKRYCLDYEIKEWNKENYDWQKNHFVRKAVEERAWAFASDFARLDVVLEYGGVYLDMDVELVKKLDILLKNKAFFNFSDMGTVDLAAFGAEKGDEFIRNLLKVYDGIPVPENKEDFRKCYQPLLLMEAFMIQGIRPDGRLLRKDGRVFLPRECMYPKDATLYDTIDIGECTFAIHQINAGWKGSEDYGMKKADRNRALYNRVIDPSRNFTNQ